MPNLKDKYKIRGFIVQVENKGKVFQRFPFSQSFILENL